MNLGLMRACFANKQASMKLELHSVAQYQAICRLFALK